VAAREQWVRDQKKLEWQELISLASEIELHMPSVALGGELIGAIKGSLLDEYLKRMTQAVLKCVFVSVELQDQGIYRRLVELRMQKEKALIDILTYILTYEQSPAFAFQQGRPSAVDVAREFHGKFAAIRNELHSLALTDLRAARNLT
jgi:hypothetical protein